MSSLKFSSIEEMITIARRNFQGRSRSIYMFSLSIRLFYVLRTYVLNAALRERKNMVHSIDAIMDSTL